MNSSLTTEFGVPAVAASISAFENKSVRWAGLHKSSRNPSNFGSRGRLHPVLRSRRSPTSGIIRELLTAAGGPWCTGESTLGGQGGRRVNSELASYRRPGHNPSLNLTHSGMPRKPAVRQLEHRHTSGLRGTPARSG
jgi:hypothetical protein